MIFVKLIFGLDRTQHLMPGRLCTWDSMIGLMAYLWMCRVMSWWDYGYQIAGMGNRTTLVDNNTWNNSHIALVSFSL